MLYPAETRLILALSASIMLSGCNQSSLIKPPENTVVINQAGDRKLSCRQLDIQIQQLYRDAQRIAPPDFSEDNSNTMAAMAGTFVFTPAYLHILHNELTDKPRQRMRIAAITERIELLRQHKAKKHCYESR